MSLFNEDWLTLCDVNDASIFSGFLIPVSSSQILLYLPMAVTYATLRRARAVFRLLVVMVSFFKFEKVMQLQQMKVFMEASNFPIGPKV
jgi:hypothetical protein